MTSGIPPILSLVIQPRLAAWTSTSALGLTPADGMYSDGFNVVNVSIKGAKSLQLTPTYSLPVFAQAILNPYTEQAYMVFGMSF